MDAERRDELLFQTKESFEVGPHLKKDEKDQFRLKHEENKKDSRFPSTEMRDEVSYTLSTMAAP